MTNATKLTAGTVIVSNSNYGMSTAQVIDHESNQWGDWYVIARTDPDNAGEIDRIQSIGDEGMLGIGWKVATADEIRRAGVERQHAIDHPEQYDEA